MAITYKEEALPPVSTFAFDINRWAGVNKIKGGQQDYEMWDCKNMSSDNYPYASPRKPREKLIDEAGIKRIYKVDGDKVYYIDAEDYLCCCEKGVKSYVSDADGSKIQMQGVTCSNNYDKCSVFYPNMQFVDEENNINNPVMGFTFGEYGPMFFTDTALGNYSNVIAFGGITPIINTDVKVITLRALLPLEYTGDGELAAEEDYKYPFSVGEFSVRIGYSIFDENGIEKLHKKITADISGRENIYTFEIPDDYVYAEGDWLRIELWSSAFLNDDFDEYKMTMQSGYIKNAEWSYICDSISKSIFLTDFDYGVVYNNRLVCVKGNDIRASALGDFSNFTEYVDEAGNPSATGAYATDVGSAGNFTGICAYNNVLLLFKKDIVYEMYGSMPYTITELCRTGCIDNDSIASIDGVLYWASPKGIVRYSGGVPSVISTQIDIKTDGICKAGTEGRKYYVYDGHKTFVYDTYYQMWHIEDEEPVKMRYNHINDLYAVYDDGIYKVNSGNEKVEWEFTTKDYTFGSAERKNLSKLWIRADMPRNSRLEIYVRQNGGDWSRVAVKTAENDEMFDFKLRVKKCDSYTIKFKGKGDVRILDIHGKVTVGTSKHRSGASLNVYRK